MKRGRPNKNLTEYPVGTNFLHDIKVQKLIRYQGAKSIAVYMCLLGNIYSEGYYMRWDDSIPSVVSSVTGCDEGYVSEVVQCCLRVNLFSQAMFLEHAVLTSRGIQQRYRDQMLLYRRVVEIKDYNIIDQEEPQLPVTIPEIVAAMHESHLWYQRLTLSLGIGRDELWQYVDEWAADMELNETKFPSAREAKKACEAWLKKNVKRLRKLRIQINKTAAKQSAKLTAKEKLIEEINNPLAVEQCCMSLGIDQVTYRQLAELVISDWRFQDAPDEEWTKQHFLAVMRYKVKDLKQENNEQRINADPNTRRQMERYNRIKETAAAVAAFAASNRETAENPF